MPVAAVPRRTHATAAGLAATIVEPGGTRNGRTLYCLPGGGMSRHYFDLDLAAYSMAEHLAQQGFVVVTIDHPGVGDSPAPDDAWSLTPAVVADADAAAVRELHAGLGGIPIGVGHSMGSMLAVAAQVRHRIFAGMGLLGFAHSDHYPLTELVALMSEQERAVIGDREAIDEQLLELTRIRFGRPLPEGGTAASEFLLGGMAVPQDARASIGRSRSAMLACCGLAAMLKWISPDMALLDVPVFIGFGKRDIAGNARATGDALKACGDITLYELPGAGHNHNVAPNRTVLWDRLAAWATQVT